MSRPVHDDSEAARKVRTIVESMLLMIGSFSDDELRDAEGYLASFDTGNCWCMEFDARPSLLKLVQNERTERAMHAPKPEGQPHV